jgi:hypothetical protein
VRKLQRATFQARQPTRFCGADVVGVTGPELEFCGAACRASCEHLGGSGNPAIFSRSRVQFGPHQPLPGADASCRLPRPGYAAACPNPSTVEGVQRARDGGPVAHRQHRCPCATDRPVGHRAGRSTRQLFHAGHIGVRPTQRDQQRAPGHHQHLHPDFPAGRLQWRRAHHTHDRQQLAAPAPQGASTSSSTGLRGAA